MSNPFYDPGRGRAARVHELFARIAPRYDLINDLQSFGLHRYWKRQVIALTEASPGQRALDLCCGTGDLAWALAQRGARVTGLDFTERMLQLARQRGPRAAGRLVENSPAPPQFVQGDALHLPFPEATFEVITIAYGLRNLADLPAGLCEIRRVAKPGARILVLDFGKPDNALWRSLYLAYLRVFVPVLGLVLSGSAAAYAYILESLRHYPGQQGVAEAMRQLGFKQVRVVNLFGGVMGINYAEAPEKTS